MIEIPEIDVREARRRVDAGSFFVDVREPSEHRDVRTLDAELVPQSTFLDAWQSVIPTDREVVVICRSGGRSGQVTEFLRERGIDAVNVTGGMLAWEREGLPVERG